MKNAVLLLAVLLLAACAARLPQERAAGVVEAPRDGWQLRIQWSGPNPPAELEIDGGERTLIPLGSLGAVSLQGICPHAAAAGRACSVHLEVPGGDSSASVVIWEDDVLLELSWKDSSLHVDVLEASFERKYPAAR